jgi:predicted dehydrogenase/threonine dehydrogenase-like Zn-dependent dehydrogenase
MLQLAQNLKDGAMRLVDVPVPLLDPGAVLVRTHYSAISVGTEARTVRDARLNPLAKARARQKEVKQVIESVRTQGLATTYNLVMNKLEALSSLGYSLSGEVVAVGANIRDLAVGDRVACGGVTAAHAEMVAVPRNLCVRVPGGIDMSEAAFTTIATIGLQGLRQAELGLGSSCVVIGLGLIGLLSVQMLKAAGIRVIGIDVSPDAVDRARAAGADLALHRDAPGLEAAIHEFTHGHGADAVIITAGTSSLDPVELAGRVSRRKGRVVIVGGVPTGFSREHYYRKELDLRMSCSYGPGRYDPAYEERGIDYPVGYVRWTENRNMEAFIDLLAAGKLGVRSLVTHEFAFDESPSAYQLILERQEPFVGVLLKYDTSRPASAHVPVRERSTAAAGAGNVGLIGAGSFAQNVLLPALKPHGQLIGVATARGNTSRHVAEKYAFEYCTSDAAQIMSDPRIDTVFVATRHGSHAEHVVAALRAGKHVFVEKPLCLTAAELDEISSEYSRSGAQLMVGFNRRFAPMIERLRSGLPAAVPRAISYRVNAGLVPPSHWVHDPAVGGGRVLGEACHFIDLAAHLAGSRITAVTATPMRDAASLQDTIVMALAFENGSTASITYFSNGNKAVPKEYLEVFAGGQVAIMDDFRTLTVYDQRVEKTKSRHADKGHAEEVRRFMDAVRTGGPPPIPYAEIENAMRSTFAVLESARTGSPVKL